MKLNNNKINNNIFFFFVDANKDYDIKLFNINNFFWNIDLLLPVKYFLSFQKNKINFSFLEKNNKLLFFFVFFGKIFFKDQLKNLKNLLNIENNLFNNVSAINTLALMRNKLYLNFFFFSVIFLVLFFY